MLWKRNGPLRPILSPLTTCMPMIPPHRFLHNDLVYVGVLRLEPAPEGLCYVVVPRGAAAPHRLLGSTVVTPVTPSPPPTSL
jgi:hypothetical protein